MKQNPNAALAAAKAALVSTRNQLTKANIDKVQFQKLASQKFKLDGQHIGELRVSIAELTKVIDAGSANRAALRSKIINLEHELVSIKLDLKGWKFATGVLAVLVIGYAATFYYAGLL